MSKTVLTYTVKVMVPDTVEDDEIDEILDALTSATEAAFDTIPERVSLEVDSLGTLAVTVAYSE